MGKFIKFPDGLAGSIGTGVVVLATLFLLYRVLPAKVKTTVLGA